MRDLAAGVRLVVHERPLFTVLVAWSLVMLANAGVNVGEVFMAKTVFGAGDFGFGFLVAAGATGLVVGSLGAGAVIERRGTRGPYGASIAIMAAGLLAAALSPNVWVASAFAVCAGIGNGAAVVCNAVLVQRGAPDRAARTRLLRPHERELPRARDRDDRRRAVHQRVRRARGLGRSRPACAPPAPSPATRSLRGWAEAAPAGLAQERA